MPSDEAGAMDRDTIIRVLTANVDHWARVRTVDGFDQLMFIDNVDDEGFVNKINDDDEYFWMTFDDIEAVWPAGDLKATETD